MRITHQQGASLIQGTVAENDKILAWFEEARKIDPSLEIVADECDEYETSYTVCSRNETQAYRQETFQQAKKRLAQPRRYRRR